MTEHHRVTVAVLGLTLSVSGRAQAGDLRQLRDQVGREIADVRVSGVSTQDCTEHNSGTYDLVCAPAVLAGLKGSTTYFVRDGVVRELRVDLEEPPDDAVRRLQTDAADLRVNPSEERITIDERTALVKQEFDGGILSWKVEAGRIVHLVVAFTGGEDP